MNYEIIPGLKYRKGPNVSPQNKMETILQAVADHFGMEPGFIKQRNRKRERVQVRQIAIYLIRKKWPVISQKAVGEFFNKLDHSTVIHACQTVEDLMFSDQQVKKDVAEIYSKL